MVIHNSARGDTENMLTSSELAKLLNVHINTVRRWSNSGLLQVYRLGPRGDRRFRRDDVESFLASNLHSLEDERHGS